MAHRGYILLATLWIAYCVVHSALISIRVTAGLQRALGNRYRFYRLFYNIFSITTLVPLLIYSYSDRWESNPLFSWEGPVGLVRYVMVALGAVLLLTASRHYNLQQFLGIRQISRGQAADHRVGGGGLDTGGVLNVVRHPWYLGVFLLLWAHNIELRDLVINLVLSAYLVVGAFLEERKLVREFGDRYRDYQRQVSMFIPVKWLRSKLQA